MPVPLCVFSPTFLTFLIRVTRRRKISPVAQFPVSAQHGFGAAVIPILVEDVLGVTIGAPGAAVVDVHVPALGDMRANGVVATQRGPVDVAWDRRGRRVTLAVTIPANVIATVHLPASTATAVRESGRSLTGDGGVRSVRSGRGDLTVEIGSGRYSFVVSG